MPWILSAFADEAGDTSTLQIAALRKAGLKHMHLRTIDGYNVTQMQADHAKRVRGQLDAAGIQCAMLASPVGKIDLAADVYADIQKLRHLASLAPILGCSAVRIFSYFNQKARKPHDAWQGEAISRLRELKSVAKDLGLVLYHENELEIFGDKADDVLHIAKELRDEGPRSCFKMIFNFGNYNAGRQKAWENWLKLCDYTDALHLKDNHWSFDGKLHHTPVGEGDGSVKEIAADAIKRGVVTLAAIEPMLRHSGASVTSIAASGGGNRSYASLEADQSFHIACQAAKALLSAAGAVD